MAKAKNIAAVEIEKIKVMEEIFDKVPVGVLVLDIKTKTFICANEAIVRLLGYTKKELLKLNSLNIHPKEVLSKVKKEQQSQVSGKTNVAMNIPVLKKNKEIIFCDIERRVEVFDGRKILIGVFSDVTKRIEIEQKIIESEQYYKTIMENNADGISVINAKGENMFQSESAKKIMGYNTKDRIRKSVFSIMHSEDVIKMKQMLKKYSKKVGITIEIKFRAMHRDGTIRFLQGTAKNMLHSPIVKGIILNYRDVTDEVVIKEKLEESEKKFKDIVDNMADWIWEVDKDGRYTYVSENVKAIFGYDQKEIIGKTLFDFMPEDEAGRVAPIVKQIFKNKQPIIDIENKNITKTGKTVYILTNGKPIFDKNGELNGYRGVDEDITERKRAETEIQEKMTELKKMNSVMIGREIKMIELKEEIKRLKKKRGR